MDKYLDILSAHKRLLYVCEVLILALSLGLTLAGRKSIPFDIQLSDWMSNSIQYSDGWYADSEIVPIEGNGSIDLLFGPYISLTKGYYTITVLYECEQNQSARPYANNGNLSFLNASEFTLDRRLNKESYRFECTEDIDNFELQMKYNGKGTFHIYDQLHGFRLV